MRFIKSSCSEARSIGGYARFADATLLDRLGGMFDRFGGIFDRLGVRSIDWVGCSIDPEPEENSDD